MSDQRQCAQCGAVLPVDSPHGLCPGCLLKWGLESQTGVDPSSHPTGPYCPTPTPEQIAAQFPDLEIMELVGRGGMGVVYKARQKRLDRLVALKILAPRVGQDEAFAKRFAREARAMAMLSHPHIVAVYDFGQTVVGGPSPSAGESSPLPPGESQAEGSAPSSPAPCPSSPLYYFIMEYVDGLNLRRLMETGKLQPEEALAIVPQICEALQYAHNHGVVHRDIKPENVLLDKEGRVKIADFGIAKLVGKEAKGLTLTSTGQIVGTPQYMAPEQIEHPLQVDHRADIYSLGVVFYQMLTGELPIGRFAPPSRKVQIDVRLDEVVLRALEKEPERRYQQASEIKTQVESIVATPAEFAVDQTGDVQRTDPVVEAKRQVHGPAIGLLITGIFNWLVVVPVVVYALIPRVADLTANNKPGVLLVAIPLSLMVLSSLMIFAALKMERLQAYGLAITASILAILISPANLIGLPIGIWALVVLSQREVRAAFANSRGVVSSVAKETTSTPGMVALVLCLAAVPIALLIGSVGGLSVVYVFALFILLGIITLVLGIMNWGSGVGKTAVIVSIVLLLVSIWGLGVSFLYEPLQLHRPSNDAAVAVRAPGRSDIVSSGSHERESSVARQKLQSAERHLELIRARYEMGVVAVDKLYEAELARDLAAAEMKGDVVATARAKLHYAEQMLAWIEMRFNAGYRVTPLDREKAKLACETARAELQDAEQNAKAGKNAEFPATAVALTVVRPLDVLQIRVMGTMIDQPIDGFYLVEPDGNVALGPLYGRVNVQGLTMEQAEATVAKQLHKTLPQAGVQVTLARRGAAWRKVVFTRSPYEIEPMDVLQVRVLETFLDQPIDGFFLVESGGSIALGPAYGRAKVKGLSFEAAERAVRRQLQRVLRRPDVQITLPIPTRGKLAGAEWRETTPPADSYKIDIGDLLFIDAIGIGPDAPIHDIYLVEPAGTVALGPIYGRAVVKGLTLRDAEKAILKKLQEVAGNPAVSVTLAGWCDGERTMLPGPRVSPRRHTQEPLDESSGRKIDEAAGKNRFEQATKKSSEDDRSATRGLSTFDAVLVYEVEPISASAPDMDKLLKVVDLRLNAGAKKLAKIRKLDDRRIEVTLMRPDVADRKRVEQLLASPGTLEFRILASARQNKALVERAEKETDQSEIRDASGNLLAWWVPVRDGEDQRLGRFDAAQRLKRRAQEKVLEVLVVADPYNVTGAYLTKAEVQRDHNGRPCIGFTLNDAGGKLLAKLTGDHLPDKQTGFAYRLGIILDGEQWSAPFIMSVIREKGQISGIFTQQQAQEIADVLNAGTLPACRLKLQPARPTKSDSQHMDSMNHLKMIGLAMHVYAQAHHAFPPAYVAGKDGQPLLSWRVLILPYLEQNELFKQFHLDEPWDSPHNKRLIAKMPDVYRSPRSSVSDSWKTNYLTVRGANTIFSGAKGIGFREIRDGTSNTIMTVEVPDAQAVVWTKPDDIPYNLQNPQQGLLGLWPDGFLAGLADGSVRFISSSIEPKVLKALLTRSGGERIEPDDFDRFSH